MSILNIKNLERCFLGAKEQGIKFVAVRIEMEGFPRSEIIVNPIDNAEAKLEYYQKAYDEFLFHKFAKGVSITGFSFGNDMNEIQEDLDY